MRRTVLALSLLAGLGLAGCPLFPTPTALKTLSVRVYGEEFIEEEIPAEATDGWAITFDKFLIVIGDVRVARSGETLASSSAFRVFNLAASSGGAGYLVVELTADARDGVHEVSYRVAPAAEATAGNASAADVAMMAAQGFSVYVEVTATDGARTKRMALGSQSATRYAGCFTTIDFDDSGAAQVQLTIHGDHLFYEDLGEDPAVRFEALAEADADDDGEISAAELAAADVDAAVGAADLGALIEALISTLGHIDGEGHCAEVTVE